jgi:autotransporter translocation and assembly factor TamB
LIRRSLQVLALAGTLLVGAVAVMLIVSQTPWFRDWVRRFVVRESKQYLNGELTIGKLGGNLFFGVQLSDVAVDLSGERVVAVKNVEVDYSIITMLSEGVILDDIKLVEPSLHLAREGDGWNIGRLVKEQRREAGREGPQRPLSLPSIEIADGLVTIAPADDGEEDGLRLPQRIEDLDVRAAFEYAPVQYSIGLQHVSFKASDPAFTLHELKGGFVVREDTLYVDQVHLRTDNSTLSFDGVIEQYLRTPAIKGTTSGQISLPEIGQIVLPVSEYSLNPVFDIKLDGPADRLAMDLDVKSEAGNLTGQVTANLKPSTLAVKGRVNLDRLDLAPLLKDRSQRSDINGQATIDLRFAPVVDGVPFFTRTSGTFEFVGPHAAAIGYEGRNIKASGSLADGRITLDAQATAYGATATASGVIVPPASGRPLIVDLRGRANGVDLTNLPASMHVPKVHTQLSIAEYHVKGEGPRLVASVTLDESVIEGATFASGTVGTIDNSERLLRYSAKGTVSNLNLVQIGSALEIEALSLPKYDSEVNGDFDVRGSGTTLETLTLDASGTAIDTSIMGARLPKTTFVARIADSGLDVNVVGPFEHLDPANVTGQEQLRGQVTGSADASFKLADLSQPVTPETVEASGKVTIGPSIAGALQIESATVVGHYRDLVGDLTQLEMKGPDLTLTASGPLALNRTSSSNVRYRVDATNLAEVGRLAGLSELGGSAVVDGTLTGNAASLQSSGTLAGNKLSYRGNQALDLSGTFAATVPELKAADARVSGDLLANFVKVGGLEIDEVRGKAAYAGTQLDFSTNLKRETRELDAAGRVIFHPDHQELHLPQLAIRAEGQEWRLAPATEAAIQYGADTLTVLDLRLVNGDQSLAAAGVLSLKADDPSATNLQVDVSNIDLLQAEELLLQDRGFSGRMNAQVTIGGTTSEPTVQGRVEVTNGGFRTYAYESLTADVGYHERRIVLDARLQQSPTEAFTAVGTVPLSLFQRSEGGHVAATAQDRVDLRIASTDLGLGFIQGFTTAVVNVSGTMQADIRVTGSGADPHLQGYVDIRQGAFAVPVGGGSYTGLDTRIELQPDIVRLKEFQLRDENGASLSVSGQLAVHERQVGEVDINLTSENFEVVDNHLGDVGLGSRLKISGELRRPRIEGDIRVATGRLEVDQVVQLFYDPYKAQTQPEVISAERLVEGSGSAQEATRTALAKAQAGGIVTAKDVDVAAAPPPGSPFDPVALNIRLVIPDNLVLRGRDLRPRGPRTANVGDLNVTVGGNLTIQKEPSEPVRLVGVVSTVRGTYQFQGRSFELVRGGTIRFTGDMNPLIDVTARRVIPNSGVEVRVHIKGTVEKPELELASTPPLEESDILAMVIFNRPVNELGSGERAALAATAGGIATGFLAAPLGESIGRALDLDLFEITTTSETGELAAGVTIGQQIGDRMFFRLRQEFGDRNLSEFVLEYQIASFLRVQASAAPESSGTANRIRERRVERAGLDLIFFFSY